MRKTTLIKALTLLLSFAMLMTGLPAPSIAESAATDTNTVIEQEEDIVIEDDSVLTEDEEIPEEPEILDEESEETPVEDDPVTETEVPTEDTEDAVFPEDETSSADTAGDDTAADADPSEESEEPTDDEFVTEDELDTPDEPVVEDEPIVEEESEIPVFFSAVSPSCFTGDEAVRLGKESSNIGGIIVQKDGSSSTSIARHWVTVDGVEYTAFCIEASDASTSGRDGGLEPGSDAGLLWILNNVPDSSDEDYAIKQQAVWAYLGQSFSIQNLAAGSRCSMSTEQLRARLTEIVTNAQNANLSGSQELWIAYHLENRSYYQDMAFTVAEPTPSITPTPTPVPTPTPTPVPVTGTIQVVKRDADTGAALAGAAFQLYDAAGYPVGSPVVTDSDGVVAWGNLPLGNYSVQEIAAPEGYNCDNGFYSLTLTENNLFLTIEVVNSVVYGKIRIIKTDADTQDVLAGAVFEVTDAYGTVVATLITGTDGTAESDWLPYGAYTVTETQAASGYINSGFSTVVNVTEHGQTYTIDVENVSMQGGIRLTKTDAVTGSPISGVQFDIYDDNGALVCSMTTNENGVAMSANLPRGQYTVKEHALPTGYTGDLVVMTADVEPNAVTDLTATNTPITSRIKIIKTDAVTGEVLPGAVFSVTDDAGYTVATITTGADGTAITDWLPYGRYTVSEVQAPDRYINSGFSTTIYAEEDGRTYTVTVENSPMQGGIRLTKTDSMTGTPIAGVEFGIYDTTGTLVASMTTDAGGVASVPSLSKGSYIVREHGNPTGYVAALAELSAEVVSDETTDLYVTNDPIQGCIRIVKKDAVTGDLLAGAEFTITRISGIPAHNGAGDGEMVATITTDTNGVAESPVLTYGTYRIDETVAPSGYVNSGYSKEVSISEDNLQTVEIVVENEPMSGGLRLTKTDSLTGSPIEGVKFNIFQGDSLIATMTTDENGIATCDNLNRGTYIVKEDSLPEGYTGELVVLDAVVQPDAVTELHATNTKSQSRIRIIKTDSLTGERLPGAEFTVTDEVGNVFAVITDENGEVTTDWLPYGVYTVRETMAPEHYVNSDWSERIAAYENGMTYTFEVSNVPTTGYIRLIKTDSMNGMPIGGVQFDIYDASDALVGTMTTDENGVAVSSALPKGNYTIREHENPAGYVAALAELPVVVHSDETTDLAVTNDPIQGKIRIVKKDRLTGDLLSGAEFTITRVSGIPAHNGAGNGEVVAVITTNESGIVESPLLTYGTYQIEETVVPEHFVDNGFSVEVTILDDNLKTYEVVVENEPAKGWLKLTKTNSLDGHPIAGVTFNIYYDDPR